MTDGSNLNPNTGAVQRLGPLVDALLEATLPACVRDAAGRYVAVNPSFADLVGLEASRLAGKTDNALQPADVAHRVAELDALVLEAHGHLDARETILARDGRRAMRACRFPVYDDG
ncbi:MAG: PAS domain-containing protein, partial [Baekduia sp.]